MPKYLADTSIWGGRWVRVDYVIAATAELAGDDVVLWALDRDLRVICGHTSQTYEHES